MLCCWFEDPKARVQHAACHPCPLRLTPHVIQQSEAFKKHLPRVQDYLWVAEDGMKMQGYNGSQLWDTAFAAQAILSTGLADEFTACLRKAHGYIDASQTRENCKPPLKQYYRHISNGAFPFSTRDHGWPISDCSAEGLKAALRCANAGEALAGPALEPQRLFDCVNIILSFQNADGGWATYEARPPYLLDASHVSDASLLAEHAVVCVAGAAEPGRDVRGHHD